MHFLRRALSAPTEGTLQVERWPVTNTLLTFPSSLLSFSDPGGRLGDRAMRPSGKWKDKPPGPASLQVPGLKLLKG